MDPSVPRGLLPEILFTDLIQPAECGLQNQWRRIDSSFWNRHWADLLYLQGADDWVNMRLILD
ncbi:hypothetical protein Oscil6304_0655 [Oscillatoria acuminata PCC 6304]|uniref:Uncharacterized protein n=1 Tax=Oscillatoria acuminata PCC 6304 TaxID=56110 RepID=K9TCY8_9CYAN|nr:hypothetical protein Oscil6304_0655 [Oscillatoria acuminata PCC 6304]